MANAKGRHLESTPTFGVLLLAAGLMGATGSGGMQMPPGAGPPPGMRPPPGAGAGHPPPNFGGMPAGPPPQQQQVPGGGQAAEAPGKSAWTEHNAPDGRKYYYNAQTKQSSWDKPADLLTPQVGRSGAAGRSCGR